MYGKTHTEEVRKMNSELKKGNTYCKGKKASEETRQKMSENAKLKLEIKIHFMENIIQKKQYKKLKKRAKEDCLQI